MRFLLALALLAGFLSAQAPTAITPAIYTAWPGEVSHSWQRNNTYQYIIDDLPVGMYSSLFLRGWDLWQVPFFAQMTIRIQLAVPPSTTTPWPPTGTGVIMYSGTYTGVAGANYSGTGFPYDATRTGIWSWLIPFQGRTFSQTVANNPILVEFQFGAITRQAGGANTSWTVEGFRHTHVVPGAGFSYNMGRTQQWGNQPVCGAINGSLPWFNQIATSTNVQLWYRDWHGATVGQSFTDVVNFGNPQLPNPPTLQLYGVVTCPVYVDTAFATYNVVIPSPSTPPADYLLAQFPWLPAYNFVGMHMQAARFDWNLMSFVSLGLVTSLAVHWDSPVPGTPMPQNSSFNGGAPNGTTTSGIVFGWL